MKAIHGFAIALIVADVIFAYTYLNGDVSELSSYLMLILNVLFFVYMYVLDTHKIRFFDFEKKLEALEHEHRIKTKIAKTEKKASKK